MRMYFSFLAKSKTSVESVVASPRRNLRLLYAANKACMVPKTHFCPNSSKAASTAWVPISGFCHSAQAFPQHSSQSLVMNLTANPSTFPSTFSGPNSVEHGSALGHIDFSGDLPQKGTKFYATLPLSSPASRLMICKCCVHAHGLARSDDMQTK